jgi:hypothetical protein
MRAAALSLVLLAACGVTLDGGSDHPHGRLPVDERNPILLANDGPYDNLQGEYAVLLAKANRLPLAGIVVGSSPAWPDLESNVAGWRRFVDAARASGLGDVPYPTASIGPPLVRPADGDVDKTVGNASEGARLIVDASTRVGSKSHPLVIVTGARLTDVADAYLLDHRVVDRVFVVSSLGTVAAAGGAMGMPNGEMDPWADAIVATRFRYVQVSAFYDQLGDLPTSILETLPANDFGAWIAAKQNRLYNLPEAADQVAVLAVGLPAFVAEVATVSADPGAITSGAGPPLVTNAAGPAWLVTGNASALATARFWQLLLDPATFIP